ncbi:MAG TPA: fasciclin domain-containing protein [Caulobacteraceae bacterium]|nr:fasciclin domain-containing protein [Caulobacteraceae bacterium]
MASAAFAQEAPAEVAAPAALAEVAAPAPAAPAFKPVTAAGDLVETAKASGQFTTFVKALDATNLTAVLKNNKNLTVFAPTDAAFAALPAGELERLMNPDNAAELQSLLVYHLVNAPVDSKKVDGAKGPVQTVAGSELLLDGSGEAVKANSATVLQADVRATNGILHVVDQVLKPGDPVIAKAKAEAAEAARPAEQTPAA